MTFQYRHSNKVKREFVRNYVKWNLRSPLLFVVNMQDPLNSVNNGQLKWKNNTDLVLLCLDYSHYYHSYNMITKQLETRRERARSSIDIWRHCRYFNPKITLPEVMAILFRNRDKLVGQYCFAKRRMVFHLEKNYPAGMPSVGYFPDEYHLSFYDWEDIDKD